MTTVYWIAKYPQLGGNPPHTHSFYQLLVAVSGEASVQMGEAAYAVGRGTILLIQPGMLHGIICPSQDTSPAKFIDVKFAVPDETLSRELSSLSGCIRPSNFDACLAQLENILTEAQFQEAFSGQVINMAFSIFLVSLLRSCRGEKSAALLQYERASALSETYKGVPVSQLLGYINQNFDRIISLDDLTQFAHVSKTTLIDIFKEMYGTTPIKYINDLRMKKAKELLADSDMSVSEISELVGFQSIHYFSRSFKAREGCTPLAYRRSHHDSRYITLEDRLGP